MSTGKVNSLINLCKNYVVTHFNNVESLFGFPETMAKSLFEGVTSQCQLINKEMSEYFVVFVAAYGPVVLSSLNLSSLTILNEHMERISCTFPHLTSLDFSHCHFGKSHDIFSCFQYMNNLKILFLSDCALEDESLRKMTIHCRVSKTGLLHLVQLAISDNLKLTPKCLPFLNCLRHLNYLKISTGPCITKEEILTYMSRLAFEETEAENVEVREVFNEGWAAPVIHKWSISGSPSVKKEHNSPSKFYGRPRLLKKIKLDLDGGQTKHPSSEISLYLVKREKSHRHISHKFVKKDCPQDKPRCLINTDVISGYLQNYSTNSNLSVCTKHSSPFDYL